MKGGIKSMAGRNYGYQYETSTRKLRPDYDIQRKKQTAKKTSKKTSLVFKRI